ARRRPHALARGVRGARDPRLPGQPLHVPRRRAGRDPPRVLGAHAGGARPRHDRHGGDARAPPRRDQEPLGAGFFFLPGRMFISLQMMPSMISSAPPPIDMRRVSRYARDAGLSHMKPMPPQYWRHESETSRTRRPALSLAIDA